MNADIPLVIQLGRGCENHCRFCHIQHDSKPPGKSDLKLLFERHHALGNHRLVIGGPEPLSEPGLDSLIKLARKAGFEQVRIETNGIRLAETNRTNLR